MLFSVIVILTVPKFINFTAFNHWVEMFPEVFRHVHLTNKNRFKHVIRSFFESYKFDEIT